ncbi:DUF881 domain-containing protein [Actinomyces culturomici]|uniref:DUF881 domain-containing protein n=1 Tax=Actinomyces culturomici TaxID=1926276 RepID=UPI000E1FC823|nr:DUF881 domain-containing protein [Actinomyces culturomici]
MSEPEREPKRGGGCDPAASMSLLTQLLSNPLDAGYTDHAEQAHGLLRWWQRLLVLLFSLALGLGSVAAVGALRDANAHSAASVLVDQAQSKRATVEALQDDVQSLSARVNAAVGTQGAVPALDPNLALANSLTPVDGPGLVVTLKDSESATTLAKGTRGAVRDLDLNVVVNALWSAGAEAIAINGIRIGPGTFIRTAGSVILVNITPVQSPYEVSAIGDANALSVALVRGSTGDFLSSAESVNGITVKTAADSTLELPGLDLRTTREAEAIPSNEGN